MGNKKGDNAGKALAEAMNGLLADGFALYLKTKNFHWHVAGPHFREYHLLLDDQATQILAITDAIAERVRKNGFRTLTSIGDIARRSSIADNDKSGVSAEAMLKELRDDLSKFGFRAVMMSGSGSTIFAVGVPNGDALDTWQDEVQAKYDVEIYEELFCRRLADEKLWYTEQPPGAKLTDIADDTLGGGLGLS